jgi:hypothetical protein
MISSFKYRELMGVVMGRVVRDLVDEEQQHREVIMLIKVFVMDERLLQV